MSDDTMFKAILTEFQELKKEIRVNFKKIDQRFTELENKLSGKIDSLDEKLTNRIDNLGNQLAYLEDDTPTRSEFDQLEKRVTKIEKITSPSIKA